MMTLRFSPVMFALRLKMPDEFKVKVVSVAPCLRISAPLAIVKLPLPFWAHEPIDGQTLPFTAIVTLLFDSAAEIIFAALESIIKSIGSKNQRPDFPLEAPASTANVLPTTTLPLELVSINPPLPPSRPPTAFSTPSTAVFTSDQIRIFPAFPWPSAETFTSALASTVTVLAICFISPAVFAASTAATCLCAKLAEEVNPLLELVTLLAMVLPMPTSTLPPLTTPVATVLEPAARVMLSPTILI